MLSQFTGHSASHRLLLTFSLPSVKCDGKLTPLLSQETSTVSSMSCEYRATGTQGSGVRGCVVQLVCAQYVECVQYGLCVMCVCIFYVVYNV